MDKTYIDNYIVRGIIIGGSLGVFAALMGFTEMGRSFGVGMFAGALAGLTMQRRRNRIGHKRNPK